jgi:hypothetical protein
MKNNFEKISVICALYIGDRTIQVDNIITNKLYYFEKQLEYLEKYKNKIFKFYFVVTFENENYFENYKHILNTYTNNVINISFKQNLGGSYTSWKFGLELDNGESDLIFLVEDDYVIYDEKSIDNIISDFKNDNELFYYCGKWSTKPITIKDVNIIAHASISNGIINNKMYHSSEYKFETLDSIERQNLFLNQITFLEPFRLNEYKIKDYTSKYSSMFSHGVNRIEEMGISTSDVIFYPLTIVN